MESPTAPAPARRKRGLKTGEKILIGCGVGCLLAGVAAFLAIAFGIGWAVSPGEQIATERIVGEDSMGSIRMIEPLADEGLRAVFERAITEIQHADLDRQREEMPESMRWLNEIQRGQANAQGFEMWVPKEATLSVEWPEGAPEPRFVAAVNLRMFPRLVRSMFSMLSGSEGLQRLDHRGHEIDRFAEGGAVAFVGGTLLFSDDVEAIKSALDRIEDGAQDGAGSPAPAKPRPPAGFAQRWDVFATFDNGLDRPEGQGRALLAWVLDDLADRGASPPAESPPAEVLAELERRPAATPPAEEVRAVHVGLDFETADRLVAEAVLDTVGEAQAEAWVGRLQAAFDRAELPEEVIPAFEARREGPRVFARLEQDGVERLLARWARDLAGSLDEVVGEYEDYGEYEEIADP